MAKLTTTQLMALMAIRDGSVVRRFTMRGNRLDCPKGIGEKTISDLVKMGFAKPGPATAGVFATTEPVIITDAGRAALEASK